MLPTGPGAKVNVLDCVLDANQADSYFGPGYSLYPTRHGARFAKHHNFFLSLNQSGSEAHPSQSLAVLAGLAIPLQSSVVSVGGQQGTLQMVFDDLKANLVLEGEIYWDAVALALYLPPQPAGRTSSARKPAWMT